MFKDIPFKIVKENVIILFCIKIYKASKIKSAKLKQCGHSPFSKHWLVDGEEKSVSVSRSKQIFYFCRIVNKHGGVSIFIKNNLDFVE